MIIQPVAGRCIPAARWGSRAPAVASHTACSRQCQHLHGPAPVGVERVASQVITSASKSAGTAATTGKGFGAPKKKIDAGADATLPCPCGSGQPHEACCQPYLLKTAKASTPEQLLRSRYTAYALKNADYIADTTHPESKEYTGSRTSYLQSVRATQRRADWQGLTIEKQEAGATPNEALISFSAYFVDKGEKGDAAGKRQTRQERSRFMKENGTWYYMEGELQDNTVAAPSVIDGLPGLPKLQLPSFKF